MYSAGDSSSDGLSGLNQFASMSGPIDWAAMAQQWIQMHDTSNFMPDAPPPPNISNTFHDTNTTNSGAATRPLPTAAKKSFDEKGEADMEMDEDEENARHGDTPPPPAPSMQLGKNRESIMQSQAPWYMQQQMQLSDQPITDSFIGTGFSDMGNNGQITPTAPQWSATVWPPRMNLPPPIAGSILSAATNNSITNPTAHIPSLLKINVPNPNTVRMMTPNVEEQNTTAAVVDAKKRKMLPAWIREGLEKMEREKQRQLEREQNKRREEPSGSDSSNFSNSVGTADDATHTVNIKYKQSVENDMSGNEDEADTEDLDGVAIGEDTLVMPQKTAKDEGSGISSNEYETDNENNAEARTYMGKRSYEDRLSDLMIVVRTTLTELLLDVTNQEIANLAQEAVNAHKAKASSAQVIRKSALSSITGKLGLAAYDDSTGDESSDTENEASADNDTNNDSEEEIKASIRAKRRAFAKITEEIEERIAANAAREEQKLKYYSLLEKQEEEDEELKDKAAGEAGRSDEHMSSAITSTVSKTYERDFGETTETKLQHSNGKRQKDRSSRKERTTRFSDNKDSKGAAAVAATYMSKMHNANANPSNSVLFPIGTTAVTSLASVAGTTTSTSSLISTMPHESTHIAYNITSPAFIDDNDGVSVLNKNLLNAAEAAFEKATKGRRASSSRSSVSRSERERSYRSSRYDHRDHESDRYRERERDRERKRKSDRERERERERNREKERHHDRERRKHKERHSSDDEDDAVDGKNESQSSSSDTDTSSTSSNSTSSTSHHSSHYSRTSKTATSKQRRQHEYERRERRDERGDRSHRNDRSRSRSQSRGRQRSHHSSHRHSSVEDDYDNDSRHRHSSSRHSSSRRRSRSRSRSTYSSSSHWRRR